MSTSARNRSFVLAGLLAAWAQLGCLGGISSDGRADNSNAGGPSNGGNQSPGSGSGNSGGSAPGGSMGIPLPGDPSAPGAGIPPSPEPAPPPPMAPSGSEPPCSVTIVPVLPSRLLDLLAGDTSILRVRAQVHGTAAPVLPAWQWSVSLQPGVPVPFMPLPGQPDAIEIPLRSPGIYTIEATAAPGCSRIEAATAFAPSDRQLTFWARISPPPGSGIPAQDTTLEVGGSQAPAKHFALARGMPIILEPQGADGFAIPSFIRVSSTRSTVRFEGHNADGGFRVALNPLSTYDVLIVPDGGVAPALLAALSPSQLGAHGLKLDLGTPVTGTITHGDVPAPLPGARVLLRAGKLPSTVGIADTTGAFALRARPAAFGAVVLPPADSGLPEARLPDGTTLTIDPGTAATVNLTFRYATLPSAPLALTVRDPSGTPVQMPVRVELESEGGATPGTFTLPGGREVPGVATFRAEAITGPDGVARFAQIPAGTYVATATPQDPAAAYGLTTAAIEAANPTAAAITLASKVAIAGRLVPAALSAGLEVVAVDPEARALGEAIRATVAPDGSFRLALAGSRSYRLQVEPNPARQLPRFFLGAVTAGSADVALPDLTLHPGVPFTGVITAEAAAVPGAVVQIFCIGKAPECVDPDDAQAGGARALGEAVSDLEGRFQVHLPDPAKWNL